MAYELWKGPIPEGYDIDHVYANGCRARDCFEPNHLEAVTPAENHARRAAVVTHCPKGHLYQGRNLIREGNRRACRACHTAANEQWRAKRRQRMVADDDRRVHIRLRDGREVVRYDRAGKWFVEFPEGRRHLLKLSEAVEWAFDKGAEVIFGVPGGARFDGLVRQKWESTGE
ncbi:HNH endonuclease [Prauserella endophytica]|uniref:HNH endonuclease n=1 Tax=Prauserella endophytica TaxID=1592324 RepID=UPI001305116E|nr:HNH endonuclease [Prauserella endophytica]